MASDATTGSGGPFLVRPLARPAPLRESVHEALTEMIIAGSLQPGQHLVEVELAGMLGVSRQPVREALQRMHNEGWVDLRPGFGAMVHVPAEEEVDQLLAVRAALESESARLAAGRATKEQVSELHELCRKGIAAVESGNVEATVQANADLHRRITEMSGNKFLIDFAAQVDRRVRWYYTPVAPARGQASWREHSRVIKAISQGDATLAAQVMRDHTEQTRKTYHDTLQRERKDTAAEGAADKVPARRGRRRKT
jgi:DNA-binding GntR family transcriptional regulator